MILSHKIITNLLNKYNYNFTYDEDTLMFCIIINFHFNKMINDKKLNSLFKSIKDNSINRKVNTYHCKIDNTWYNNVIVADALKEVYIESCPKKDIPINSILLYLNKYLNANKNYCIDWLYSNLVEPLIYNNDNYNKLALLEIPNIDIISYDEADLKYNLADGYCCKDCDGCLGEYKRSRYKHRYAPKTEEITKEVKSYFYKLKTHHKNPKDNLK